MTTTPTPSVLPPHLQKLIEDFGFETGKSTIAMIEGVDSRTPEGIAIKQGFNRAYIALSDALAAIKASQGDALSDIATERARQISAEGWTPEHDDCHNLDEMAIVAAAYADPHPLKYGDSRISHPIYWPRGWSFKPGVPDPKNIGKRLPDRRRDLVRAAALLLAEIERLDRAAIRAKDSK